MYLALFLQKTPKNIEREPQFPDLGDFRASKTRVLASSFSVFRTRAPNIIRNTLLFPHLAVKLLKINAFSYVKYKVLAFPQILKPRVLHCFEHIFHAKTQPNAAKPCFFTLEKSLNTRFGGPPRASRRPKKHDFQRF